MNQVVCPQLTSPPPFFPATLGRYRGGIGGVLLLRYDNPTLIVQETALLQSTCPHLPSQSVEFTELESLEDFF
jgi:hypothetical protein